MHFTRSLLFSVCTSLLLTQATGYSLDCSFPIHNKTLRADCDDLEDRSKIYETYMNGCRAYYSAEDCDGEEEYRLKHNRLQPPSMVNYTSGGFRKVRAPPALRKLLSDFWEKNKDEAIDEEWYVGNIFTNHWEVPTKFVDVSDDAYVGGGGSLMSAIWDVAKSELEEWTGMRMRPSSLYGIRIYREGSILSPHVDRLPLISSCIVNVAQDVDEDWPLEVYDRFGDAINVTMQPFDMVFYESHSLLHGRPFPLVGRYFANVFIHFEATGEHLDGRTDQSDNDSLLPPYIIPDSPWAKEYLEDNPTGWSKVLSEKDIGWLHELTAEGELATLTTYLDLDPRLVNVSNDDGWHLLHYAVIGEQLEIVKFLIERGVDLNPDTSEGSVPFPLNVAISELGEDHPITKLLIEVGAEEGDYELEDEDEFDEGESGEEEDTTDEEELEWEGDL